MVDPSTIYETRRMSVLVERQSCGVSLYRWLVCANRRQSARFIGASTVAWCETREQAQALARMLAGVEFTREGAAIWPDGRTEPEHAHDCASLDCEYDPRPCNCSAGVEPPEPEAHPLGRPVDALIDAIRAMPVDDTGRTVGDRLDALNASLAEPDPEPAEPMEIADAIEIVLDLAHQNVVDEREFPEECAHQMRAYDLVHDLLSAPYRELRARDLIRRLVAWLDGPKRIDARVWAEARAFLQETEPRPVPLLTEEETW